MLNNPLVLKFVISKAGHLKRKRMKSFFVKYVFFKKKTSFFPEIFNVIIKTTCSRNKGARVSHRTVIIVGRGGGITLWEGIHCFKVGASLRGGSI